MGKHTRIAMKRPDLHHNHPKNRSMVEQIEFFEDCIECNETDGCYVRALMDMDEQEIVKFIYQECKHCGWNQYS